MYLHLSPSENNAALQRLNTRAFTKIQKWDAVQEYMNAGGYSCAEIVVRGPSSPKENCRCLVSFHGCWNEVLTYANKYVSNFCLLSLINIQWFANFANKYGVEDIVWKSYWDLFPPDYPKFPQTTPKCLSADAGGFIENSLPNSSDTEIQMYLRQWTNCSLCQICQ